jgi:hypothetical protein
VRDATVLASSLNSAGFRGSGWQLVSGQVNQLRHRHLSPDAEARFARVVAEGPHEIDLEASNSPGSGEEARCPRTGPVART